MDKKPIWLNTKEYLFFFHNDLVAVVLVKPCTEILNNIKTSKLQPTT